MTFGNNSHRASAWTTFRNGKRRIGKTEWATLLFLLSWWGAPVLRQVLILKEQLACNPMPICQIIWRCVLCILCGDSQDWQGFSYCCDLRSCCRIHAGTIACTIPFTFFCVNLYRERSGFAALWTNRVVLYPAWKLPNMSSSDLQIQSCIFPA